MSIQEIGPNLTPQELQKINANFQQVQATVNSISGEVLNEVIGQAQLIWKEPVNTFDELTTTYPTPEVGWTSMARDDGKVYRHNGTSWAEIQQIDASPINELDSRLTGQLDEKVAKEESGVITPVMLSQETKEQMTGGSVAVVGENSILPINITPGAAEFEKRTPVGGFSVISVGGSTQFPNINTSAKQVEFKAPFTITHGKKRAVFSDNVNVPFDLETIQYVLFNHSTNSFRIIRSSSASQITEQETILMVLTFTTSGLSFLKKVWCSSEVTLNGAPVPLDMAAVPTGGVTTEKLGNESATFAKRTKSGSLATLTVEGSTTYPNINTTDKRIEFSAPFFVTSGNKREAILTSVNVPFDLETGQYVLFDFSTKTIRMLRHSSASQIKESEVIIMLVTFNFSSLGSINSVWSTSRYSVNGKIADETFKTGVISISAEDRPAKLDIFERTITFKPPFYVSYDNKTASVGDSVDVVVPMASGAYSFLMYDTASNSLLCIDRASFLTRSTNLVYLGSISHDGAKFTHVDISCQFVTNPKYYPSGEMPKTYYFSPEDVTGYYEPSDTETYDSLYRETATTPLQDVYDLYQQLQANHPDYFTMTERGLDASGQYPIYEIALTPEQVDVSAFGKKIPKIIFIAGIHGGEKNAIFSTYYFIKDLCERWENNPQLEYLRWNIEFRFIPVANPWAFENGLGRRNSNDVDINRNFDFEWTLGDISDGTYGGPAPFSEAETIIIRDFILRNKDAIYYGDYHNHDQTTWGNLIWQSGFSDPRYYNETIDIASKHILQLMTRKLTSRYAINKGTGFIGYASYSGGAKSKNYAASKGIPSSTFECFPELPELNGMEESVKASTEYTGNWFLTLVKAFKDDYSK